MNISINIPYWNTGDENRLWNVGYAIKCAERLVLFLKLTGIEASLNIFDFSEDQVLKNAIHLPTPGEFNKAQKINKAISWLENNNKKTDWLCFWDADCFIEELEFRFIPPLLFSGKEKFYCNNMNKLRSRSFVQDGFSGVENFAVYYASGVIKGLGAIWICSFDKVIEAGRFNETFTDWGKEDEEIGERLTAIGVTFEKTPFQIWHLPHRLSKTKNVQLSEKH